MLSGKKCGRGVDGWPGGGVGLALWFEGAPENAALVGTQFWHPDLSDVCDREREFIVATVASQGIKWKRAGNVPKALMHFAVTSLRQMIFSDGNAAVGYSGPAIRVLRNAFRPGKFRCSSVRNIFGVAGNKASLDVQRGEPMERTFIVVEGSELVPIVRLHQRFDIACGVSRPPPIYIFWQPIIKQIPDWGLHRVLDLETLDRLAGALEMPRGSTHLRAVTQSLDATVAVAPSHDPQTPVPSPANSVAVELVSPHGGLGQDKLGGQSEPSTATAKRTFLRFVFGQLLDTTSIQCLSSWATNFLCDEVEPLRPPFASADDLVDLCSTDAFVEASYQKSLTTLNRDWPKLRPTVKNEILNYLAMSSLSCDLDKLPPLSVEDQEELRINWTAADCAYAEAKLKALKRCEPLGFDITRCWMRADHLDAIVQILCELLDEKIRIDKREVAVAESRLSRITVSHIHERVSREFVSLLNVLRESLAGQYTGAIRRLDGVSGLPHFDVPMAVRVDIGDRLVPFKKSWRKLETLHELLPNDTLPAGARVIEPWEW